MAVESSPGTALVLGGGGSTGNAWLIGVIAGLAEAGVDLSRADLVVGTSAGATAAAQITGRAPTHLLAEILAAPPPPATVPRAANGRTKPVTDQMKRSSDIISGSLDMADMRRRMGAAALDLDAAAGDSWHSRWRSTVAARLPRQLWPDQRLLITAVDARTGDPVVFDSSSGVDLVDAVAASCSSGPAYGIGTGRYIDGGYRSNADNADLAAGHARVLVLSPFGGRTRTPAGWGMQLSAQVAELEERGSRVETVFPDSDSEYLFGANAMDPTLRPVAARAGYDQGRALAGRLADFGR